MNTYEKVLDLALRKGFFLPAGEIYNGPAGFFDYGPNGAVLKRKFIELWRKMIVTEDEMIELDGSQILPEAVYRSSGHLEHFVDPLVLCTKCKAEHRADKLISNKLKKEIPENLSSKEFNELIIEHKIACPNCKGKLGEVHKFNMMFRFEVGSKGGEIVGLRPETCQNIFIDFPRIYRTNRLKLPIGIAQVGKSFRNEISPRQSLLRQREFTQAEAEVFINPKAKFEKFKKIKSYKLRLLPIGKEQILISANQAVQKGIISNEFTAYYLALLQKFFEEVGLKKFRFKQLNDKERAFYAKESWDFEVETDIGWLELVACNYRGDHDLKSHGEGSKSDTSVLDGTEKVLPHVFELSLGVDRSIYALLEQAYAEEDVKDEKRTVLKLKPRLSPVFAAVFPLVNKDKLPKVAQTIHDMLKQYGSLYDDSGSIGKRYRRMDEIGCPVCITIDFDSLKKKDVTVRDRDTMKQKRIKITKLLDYLFNVYSA